MRCSKRLRPSLCLQVFHGDVNGATVSSPDLIGEFYVIVSSVFFCFM